MDNALRYKLSEQMKTWDNIAKDPKQKLGDQAPQWKDIVIVVIIAAMLIAFSWAALFKFGWFH